MNKGLYIRNIEGLDAYKLGCGEKTILTKNWTGYIPYSLELLKLIEVGVETYQEKMVKVKDENGKNIISFIEKDGEKVPQFEYIIKKAILEDFTGGKNSKSLDIINVDFRCGYDNSDIVIESDEYKCLKDLRDSENKNKLALTKQITSLKGKIKRAKDITELDRQLVVMLKMRDKKIIDISDIKIEMENLKTKINVEELRNNLYENGFIDENGVKFILFKRSGSKSRQGKVMFIREDMAYVMLNWGRMNIDFPTDIKVDVVGIGAYSSLVSSSIEDTIIINPSNILIVNEIESAWTEDCKKVLKGADEHLEVIEGEMELESCATDGSSLLDASCFEEGIDFKLLRNHMFKSCAFKSSIQLYYQDYCTANGLDYDTFTVTDIFGNVMLAKGVQLIITKNSLKAFKFSEFIADGTEKATYTYWKEIVARDNNIFGVCKHNHASKWSFDEVEYNQMSYQMLNSMPFTRTDLLKLTAWERDYVLQLKNDIEVFKAYLLLKAKSMNCNKAMVAVLNKSPKFENTETFRTFRAKTINKYMDKLKSGKIKNVGDYCTLVANPLSYLKMSVGAYSELDLELTGNQIYTKLFEDKKELVCFRNPHTSQSNVYIGLNTYNADIDKYFNFGRNIIAVNCINNSICQIMSGMDFDSDNCIVYDNETLVRVGKKCYGHYKVCENGIPKDDTKYILTNENLAEVDNKLSKSKFTIGRVTNIGQLAMSSYNDKKNSGATDDELKELQEIIDIMTILCGVSIDNAKKTYDIDIDAEIDHIVKKLDIDKKPLFWRYVSSDKRLNTEEGRADKLAEYKTPMDMLAKVLKVGKADDKTDINLKDLLDNTLNKDDANRKQINELKQDVTDLDTFIGQRMGNKTTENEKETFKEIDWEIEKLEGKFSKKNIKASSIYAILLLLAGEGQEKKVAETREIGNRLINILYNKSHKTFLSVFM